METTLQLRKLLNKQPTSLRMAKVHAQWNPEDTKRLRNRVFMTLVENRGTPLTLREIAKATGGKEGSIGSTVRDLRRRRIVGSWVDTYEVESTHVKEMGKVVVAYYLKAREV